jgi:outer membrane protein
MKKVWLTTIAFAGMIAMASPASATEWTLGAGAGLAPDHEGSDDYTFVPLWNIQAKDLYHPDTYVRVFGPKLSSNFLAHDNFRLGLSAQYIGRRKYVDSSAINRLGNTDRGFMLGAIVGYDFKFADKNVLGIELDGRYDVKDNVGALVTLRGKYTAPLRGAWIFNAGVESTYASDDYMDEFFSVGAAGSANSGLPVYSADAGIKDVGLNAGITYMFSDSWSTTGLVSYKRLLGDADDDSPVTDTGSEHQLFGGLLVNYHF